MKDTNSTSLGAKIKFYRRLKGLTQAQMADKLGIQITSYYRYEHDIHKPKDKMLQEIADILGIRIMDFYDEASFNLDKMVFDDINFDDPSKELCLFIKDILVKFNYKCLYKPTLDGWTLTVDTNGDRFILDEQSITNFKKDIERAIYLLVLEKLQSGKK